MDEENESVIVGKREEIEKKKVLMSDVNWMGEKKIEDMKKRGMEVLEKVR